MKKEFDKKSYEKLSIEDKCVLIKGIIKESYISKKINSEVDLHEGCKKIYTNHEEANDIICEDIENNFHYTDCSFSYVCCEITSAVDRIYRQYFYNIGLYKSENDLGGVYFTNDNDVANLPGYKLIKRSSW